MDFFSGIGAKLSETGQKAKKTANDLVEITRLNGQINDMEKAVRELYTKLGEQYFQLRGQEAEEALAELCGQIKAKQDEIAFARADLQRLKNVVSCPACGCENPATAKFCAQCSTPLPELPQRPEAEVQEGVCPSCGAALAPGAKFCTKCGAKLEQN